MTCNNVKCVAHGLHAVCTVIDTWMPIPGTGALPWLGADVPPTQEHGMVCTFCRTQRRRDHLALAPSRTIVRLSGTRWQGKAICEDCVARVWMMGDELP